MTCTDQGNGDENITKKHVLIINPFQFHFSSASNRIIHAKDHASIQISLAEVDPQTGRMTEESKSYALCGAIRRMGESDDCINRLTQKDGLIAKYDSF